MLLLTRDACFYWLLFKPLSHEKTFSFLLFHMQCVPYYFFYKWGDRSFRFLVEVYKKGANFPRKGGGGALGTKLEWNYWYRCKEVLMNQVFDSTHKENIKKTREFITAIVDTKKLRVCENIPLRGNRDNTKNHPEVLIILVELL